MWTSQVYGHQNKMARTKTHRTSQTQSIQRRNIHKEITICYKTTWVFGIKWNDILKGFYTSNGARRRTSKQ